MHKQPGMQRERNQGWKRPRSSSSGLDITMKKFSAVVMTVLMIVFLSPNVNALTITNGTEESLKITIEKWQRRINPGDSATFTPTNPPVLLQFELRNYYIPCTANTEDNVLVENAQCFVNGKASGESQVRM